MGTSWLFDAYFIKPSLNHGWAIMKPSLSHHLSIMIQVVIMATGDVCIGILSCDHWRQLCDLTGFMTIYFLGGKWDWQQVAERVWPIREPVDLWSWACRDGCWNLERVMPFEGETMWMWVCAKQWCTPQVTGDFPINLGYCWMVSNGYGHNHVWSFIQELLVVQARRQLWPEITFWEVRIGLAEIICCICCRSFKRK